MTVQQAAKRVLSKLDGNMMAVEAHEAPDSFLIICTNKEYPMSDYSNAIYVVNKKNGDVIHFNPATNPEKFTDITTKTKNLIQNPIV